MVFAIHQHESTTGMHMFPPTILKPLPLPFPPYPSGLSQTTDFECHASGIKLALVIYFTCGNVHFSMLFSQIIPPCLLPLSPVVCSLHLCLLCCPWDCWYHLSKFHIYASIYSIYLSLFDLLHSV